MIICLFLIALTKSITLSRDCFGSGLKAQVFGLGLFKTPTLRNLMCSNFKAVLKAHHHFFKFMLNSKFFKRLEAQSPKLKFDVY